jgi:hypothetical protein
MSLNLDEEGTARGQYLRFGCLIEKRKSKGRIPDPELVALSKDHLARHELLGKSQSGTGPVAFDLLESRKIECNRTGTALRFA